MLILAAARRVRNPCSPLLDTCANAYNDQLKEGAASVEGQDDDPAKPRRSAAYAAGTDSAASKSTAPSGDSVPESSVGTEAAESSAVPAVNGTQSAGDDQRSTVADPASGVTDASARRLRPDVSSGIGCAALLLPLVAVAGAVLCFFAGVLSTASGCSANGSALCSSSGPWYVFALPVFVSPLVAAVTAIAAVTVRRHRSTWLAVGYGIVFISIIVGLAVASTGSS